MNSLDTTTDNAFAVSHDFLLWSPLVDASFTHTILIFEIR